jgi:CubicO group peptidase (beta-lactamase class C family)
MLRKIQKCFYLPMLLVCISFLGLVCSVLAQEKPAPAVRPDVDYSRFIARIKERLLEHMAQANVPGLAIALVDGDKLVWAEGFGTTDRNSPTKVTADTLFGLMSVSKTYTATGFLIAVEKGLMKIDDPLKKYYPQFTVNSRFGANEADRITFRHLLSHHSGLPHEPPCGKLFNDRECTFADRIRNTSETWLKFPVGERYSYSNLGIDLAGYGLELRAGKPFDEFMNEELFRPLGMTSSTFNHKVAANHPSLAKGHTRDSIWPVMPFPKIPAGGMYSTVKDMAKFISFHLAGGKIGGKQIIGKNLLKEMYTLQYPIEGQVAGYGLGIYIQPLYGGTLLYHNGSGAGISTSQWWIPEYQVGVAVLTNSTAGAPQKIAMNVLREMIKVKHGLLPQTEPARFTDKPIIKVDPKLLQRVAGTYQFNRDMEAFKGPLITFKVREENLYLVSATAEVKLNAVSPTEFMFRDQKYKFILGEKGKPRGLQVVASAGIEFVAFNDSPYEEAGPDKKEWQDFVGEYLYKINDDILKVSVIIKNGYLYIDRSGGLKLDEYKPGLFFTADGEPVIFQDDRMLLDNMHYRKKSTKTSSNIPRSSTIHPADKYAESGGDAELRRAQ